MARASPSVLFISHSASRTGAPIGLLAFIGWLRANTNIPIATILRETGPLADSFAEHGETLTLAKSRVAQTAVGRKLLSKIPPLFRIAPRRIIQMVKSSRSNIIYSNTITNGPLLHSLASLRLPVVTHVHELEYWTSKAGPQNLKQVIHHTSHFIAASHAVQEFLAQRCQVPRSKISVVYEHIRTLPDIPSDDARKYARRLLGVPENAFVVGSSGVEFWRKGRDLVPQLLVALQRHQGGKVIHFVWIGNLGNDEEERCLKYDLETAGVASLYHATGEVADPFQLYPAIDAFALLSREDPYPLACLEAAATEKPVLCYADAGGMPEFVRDGCGIIIPYLDVDGMAKAIVRLAEDRSLARSCAVRARLKVAAENTLTFTGPKLQALITSVLESRD